MTQQTFNPLAGDVASLLFKDLDTDGTGAIRFEQFAAWWDKATPANADRTVVSTAWDCFDAHDTNQNDTLDEVEFGRMLKQLAGTGWHSAVDPASGQTYWAHPITKGATWHEPSVGDFLGGHGISLDALGRAKGRHTGQGNGPGATGAPQFIESLNVWKVFLHRDRKAKRRHYTDAFTFSLYAILLLVVVVLNMPLATNFLKMQEALEDLLLVRMQC
jgi:hypothetical protein